MTNPTTEDFLTQIDRDIAELTEVGGLLDRLREAIYVPTNPGPSGLPGASGFESKPPWDTAAANLYFEVLAEAVELEYDLRWRLSGPSKIERSRTHDGALRALLNVPDLAAKQDPKVLRSVARQVRRMTRAIRSNPAVDDEARLVRLNALCPFCKNQSLFVPADASGDVVCLHVDCIDPGTGKTPRWHRSTWLSLLAKIKGAAA